MKINIEAEAYEILTVLSCLKSSADDAAEETPEQETVESAEPDANSYAYTSDGTIEEIITRRMTMETMRNVTRAGELQIGDQLSVELDGKTTYWDVIGIDVDQPAESADCDKADYSNCTFVTVQMHDLLLEEMPFDEDGSNKWESSSLRKYLNSEEFASRLELGFRKHLTDVRKDNDGRDDTTDTFFLLSKDEFDAEKTCYPYYQNQRNRVKFASDGTTDWHLTRSAHRSYAYGVWVVNSTGAINNSTAYSAYRCAPACVLIF